MKKILGLIFLLVICSVGEVIAGNTVCGTSLGTCADTSVQGTGLLNTQTTGAATTAVTVTITAVTGSRAHIYDIEARCNTAAATSDVLVSDGGTTIWSSGLLAVTNAVPQFKKSWPIGLTGATNSQVLITLAACTAGTGTLIVQADRW